MNEEDLTQLGRRHVAWVVCDVESVWLDCRDLLTKLEFSVLNGALSAPLGEGVRR